MVVNIAQYLIRVGRYDHRWKIIWILKCMKINRYDGCIERYDVYRFLPIILLIHPYEEVTWH